MIIKQKLEKMFDDEIKFITSQQKYNIKQFIFNEIIIEVIKSIIDRPFLNEAEDLYKEGYDDCIKEIKQKAKDLYNITL